MDSIGVSLGMVFNPPTIRKSILFIFLLFLFTLTRGYADDTLNLKLQWLESTEQDLAGYRVFNRTGFRRNFPFNNMWRGSYYENKQIEVYAVTQGADWLVITIITRYF